MRAAARPFPAGSPFFPLPAAPLWLPRGSRRPARRLPRHSPARSSAVCLLPPSPDMARRKPGRGGGEGEGGSGRAPAAASGPSETRPPAR